MWWSGGLRVFLSYLGQSDLLHTFTGITKRKHIWFDFYYFTFCKEDVARANWSWRGRINSGRHPPSWVFCWKSFERAQEEAKNYPHTVSQTLIKTKGHSKWIQIEKNSLLSSKVSACSDNQNFSCQSVILSFWYWVV